MDQKKQEKDLVLFVSRTPALGQVIKDLKATPEGEGLSFALLYQNKPQNQTQERSLEEFDLAIKCNFDSPKSLITSLKPYKKRLLAATARSESNIPVFQKVIPFLPYLRTPTTESLEWSINKVTMRRRFAAYDRSITPRYKLLHNSKKETLDAVEKRVGFPLVVKPIGLHMSLLVNIAYHREELKNTLNKVFRKIRSLYKQYNGRGEPTVLVEEFMDGEMYSIDVHVSSRGKVHFNPLVYIKTGRSVGFDDFFAYQTITPTKLNKTSIRQARETAEKAVHALGLRSTTAHIELMKTEQGWKVIEVGPRIGGFREKMYRLSFGINLAANDLAIRIPRKLSIPQKIKGHTAVIKIFPKKEGRIKTLTGIKKVQTLDSFYNIKINKKVGDRAYFAKHGGKEIFHVIFFHTERSDLLADIRRFEQMVEVETG